MARKKYLLFVFILGLIISVRFFIFYSDQTQYQNGQEVEVTARLAEEPQIKFGRQQFRLKDAKNKKITIITGLNPIYQYGDRLKVSGVISLKEYEDYIFTSINFPAIQKIDNDQNFITGSATHIRRFAKNMFDKSMPEISSNLLLGILFGGNQGMPEKFMQDLRVSGVVHVIAASGMNVTFVAAALISVFGALVKRQIALTIAIFGIVFYAYLAGFEPSIIRASIMAVMAFSAQLLGKQNAALIATFLTGWFMLVLQPNLITDVGFQLSFLATFGILTIKPLLDRGLKKFGILGRLGRDSFTTTVSAQITTSPIILGVFGSIGILSVLVNVLVLWTVPVLMVLGAFALLFGLLYEPFGKVFLYLALPILLYFEKVIRYFGGFGLNLTISEVSPFVWIGYYLILLGLVIYITKDKVKTDMKS